MAKIQNITTSPTETTLVARNGSVRGSRIRSIRIANFSDHADGATVNLFLEDASDVDFYIIKNVTIPKGVTLVLTDNISFNSSIYDLRLTTTGSANCDIIIK